MYRQSQARVNQAQAVQAAKPGFTASAHRSPGHPRMGNQAAQRLLCDGVIQAKLIVNEPGDKFEQEADRVAETVMRMPDSAVEATGVSGKPPGLQRLCTECEEELRRKPAPGSEKVEEGFRHPSRDGRPLPDSERRFFEPRFGRDFSQVRTHSGEQAAEAAQSVNALAHYGKRHRFRARPIPSREHRRKNFACA